MAELPLIDTGDKNSDWEVVQDEEKVKTIQDLSIQDTKEDSASLNITEEQSENVTETINLTSPVIDRSMNTLIPDLTAIKGFQNFEDTESIEDLKIVGQLPKWLVAEYFRVGPGTYDIKYLRKVEIDGQIQNASAVYTFGHWFDALPLVNRFDLHGERNSITYRNRLTSKRLVEKIREHHGYSPLHPAGLYMSTTNQTVLTKLIKNSSKASKPDAEPCGATILTSIPGLPGRLYCQNYANHIQELDPFDLKPIKLLTWNEVNPAFKGSSSCPNGQYDTRTGEYINFTMEVGYQSVKYHFFSISDRNPQGRVIGSISAPMAHINTFSITPKYIILVICPMLPNAGGMKYNWCESILESFSFRQSEPTLFYVISRESGDVIATYRSDPCFVFNHINAYEDDSRDNVFIDMICYPDGRIADQLVTQYLREPSTMKPPRLMESEVRRYALLHIGEEKLKYLSHGSSIPSFTSISSRLSSVFKIGKSTPANYGGSEETYGAKTPNKWYSWMPVATYNKRIQPSVESPSINPYYKMYKHSIMYGLGFSASNVMKKGAMWDSIVKINLESKSVLASWHQHNCYPSEPTFIPRPSIGAGDEVAEDEGVLMSIVMDASKSTSFILVLDAITFKVLATADTGCLIPLSFSHGSYRLRDI
ncbi:carotenoid oxygenase [Pilobolus umbonatus]|nr:carotenoid oxygenase [Pilobolus umbonatus]